MPDPKRTSPADPQVLAFFQQELARTAALPGLAAADPALWPRFAGYYQGLARLPRKVRRALQRRWRRSLGSIALLCALGQAPALAATISVGAGCTLVDAITAANTDVATGGCSGGSGADTITLPFSSTHTLTTVNNNTDGRTGLPIITSAITIEGNFSTIRRDISAPQFRIFAVGATGNLRLTATAVTGGEWPIGGGILNDGTLSLFVSTISENTALASYGGAYGSGDGGGIDNSGVLTLTNSPVRDNRGNDGGGIHNSGTVSLTDSSVSGNSAGTRGGGLSNDSFLILTNSTVSGNTVGDRGGGVDNTETATLTNSTVSRNTSGRAAGGVFNTGSLTLVQSLLSGNTAQSL